MRRMELTAHRRIRRPAAEVFAFVSDAANNPSWQRGMVSCKWEGEGPVQVGSRYRQEARFLGRPVRSVFRVVELEPGRRIRIATVQSTFPITVERRVEPVDDATCTVSATIGGGPAVPALLRPVLRRLAQRSVDADYDRLVDLLERPCPPS